MDSKAPIGVNSNPAAMKTGEVVEAYTFRKDGLPRIQKSLIAFGITLLLSVALVAVCQVILLKIRPIMLHEQQNQSATRDKYNQAESERIEIRDFLPKFLELRARGFVGEEKRLDMLEAIKSIQQAHRLFPISYQFAPQQTVVVDPTLLEPPLELRATRVTLHMKLLHELDLLNLLQDLKQKGFYTVKDCALMPTDALSDTVVTPQLIADCTLYWLTISETAAPASIVPAQ